MTLSRTGYSFRRAIGSLPDVVSRVKEIGSDTLAVADTNSTFSFVKLTKLCQKEGLKIVYGVELAVVPELGAKKPVTDFWRFLAKDNLKSLHQLIGLATSNPGKEPSLLYSQALAATDVIKIAGERVLLDHLGAPAEDLYVALSPATPKGLYNAARKAGHRFIACSDNYYPRAEDKELYRVALGRRSNTQTYPMYILSDEEWRASVDWFFDSSEQERAIQNRSEAFQMCTATLGKAKLLIPDKPKTLRQMCEEGAVKLWVNLDDPIYKARLDRELQLIDEKKFEDYFYILADMIGWAKQRMIVGPARGSSAGSLVCYLLDITTIDPLKYDLIFERFIDVNRTDLPDIDVDFSDARRQLVFDYVEKKYGKERVARLGTVGMFQPRSALNQAGKSLKIPTWKIERTLEGLIERSGGDSRALQTLEDTLASTEAGRNLLKDHPEAAMVGRMEGHPNNAGQHAAGIVITQQPVSDYVAVDARTKATMCDKYDAESLNLLKVDALGLTQLSIFEQCLRLIGKPDRNGYLETVPLDDQAAFDILNNAKWAGIFQFNGGALQSLAKQIKTNCLEDIVSITALARPGPMSSGNAHLWVKRKTGQEAVKYLHPKLEPYLNKNLGIPIYQENIMQISRDIGGLSWGEVSELRRAMSRSLGKEFFDRFGDKFKANAIKDHGFLPEIAEKSWDELCEFGAMGFNLAHAVSYGLVSYYCCYLKAHRPLEFAAATLEAESDPQKQIQLLRELAYEGIDYVAVDPELSTNHWVPAERDGKKILIGPLTNIKGIGPAAVNEILSCRKRGEPLRPTLAKRLASAQTSLDTLFPISDAVKRLHPDLAAINIISEPWKIRDVQCGVKGDVVIIGVARKIAPKDENEAVNIAKRGGKRFEGPTDALNLFIADDSDEIFAKVNRFDYERIGREIVERGGTGKAIYAIKGECWRGFRGIGVKQAKFLGMIDD